jgi:uncharacterized protein YndB with AHSA1/START domain
MTKITVEATINAPVEKVWKYWNEPEHITQWCFASDDWHAPSSTNDLRVGGKLNTRMEAKDGSMGFDMEVIYSAIEENKLIEYGMGDRTVSIKFNGNGNTTTVSETFDAESENPIEMQRAGWQAILDNFKKHVEAN